MIKKYLNSRFLTLYLIPFIIGSFTTLTFQPFNYTFINLLVFPTCFYLLVFINKKSRSIYRKKPYKKNFFIFGMLFGFGFYLSSISWITNSLTFDENFKILIPFSLILIPLFLSLFIAFPFFNWTIFKTKFSFSNYFFRSVSLFRLSKSKNSYWFSLEFVVI